MRKTLRSFLGGLCALALAGCAAIPNGNVQTKNGTKNTQKAPACKVYGLTKNEKDYAVQSIPEGKTAAVGGYVLPRESILGFYAVPMEGSVVSFSDGEYNLSNSNTIVFANVYLNDSKKLQVNTNSAQKTAKISERKETKPRIKAEAIGENASRTKIDSYNKKAQTTRIGNQDFEIYKDNSPVYLSTNTVPSEGFYVFNPVGSVERTLEFGKTNMTESIKRNGYVFMALPGVLTNEPVYVSTVTNNLTNTVTAVAATNGNPGVITNDPERKITN